MEKIVKQYINMAYLKLNIAKKLNANVQVNKASNVINTVLLIQMPVIILNQMKIKITLKI